MPYASVASLKALTGVTDTDDDALFLAALERATATVDAYLTTIRRGYVGFAAASNARTSAGSNTRTYSGDNSDTLFIDDAASIASVAIYGTTIDSSAYVAEPLNGVPKRFLTMVAPNSLYIGLHPAIWQYGTANITVTGYWGLPVVPRDVEQVTLQLGLLYFRRGQNSAPDSGYGPTAVMTGGKFFADSEAAAILSALDDTWGIPVVFGA